MPEYELVLQTALKEKHLKESDAEIVDRAGLPCSPTTLQRFRLATLGENARRYQKTAAGNGGERHSTLMLDYMVAVKLWDYCRHEIDDLVHANLFPFVHAERLAVDTLHAFYATGADTTVSWKTGNSRTPGGLKDAYFCYKPSFRRPGYIVKSLFQFDLIDNDFIRVKEKQATKTYGVTQATEESEGFALSKSGRLWLIMRETSHQQPRIFCINKTHTGSPGELHTQESELTRLFGFVLESDTKFSSGVFPFRVGFVSLNEEQQQWQNLYPDVPYDLQEQIDTVSYPTSLRAARSADAGRVMVDEEVRKHLKQSMTAGIDPYMLDAP